MNGICVPIVIIILSATIVVSTLRTGIARRGRPKACQIAAAQLGLQFSFKDRIRAPGTCPHSLFRLGGGGRGSNVMWGNYRGVKVACFDYSFSSVVVTTRGTATPTSYALCALVQSPVVAEALVIRPRTFDDRLGLYHGETDMDVGSAKFSRRFVVQCSDRGFALKVLSPPMMELLLAHRGPHVELNGDSILLYLPQGASPKVAGDIEKMLQLGCEMIALLPARAG